MLTVLKAKVGIALIRTEHTTPTMIRMTSVEDANLNKLKKETGALFCSSEESD